MCIGTAGYTSALCPIHPCGPSFNANISTQRIYKMCCNDSDREGNLSPAFWPASVLNSLECFWNMLFAFEPRAFWDMAIWVMNLILFGGKRWHLQLDFVFNKFGRGIWQPERTYLWDSDGGWFKSNKVRFCEKIRVLENLMLPLEKARSWTQWSFWVSSKVGHSMTLWATESPAALGTLLPTNTLQRALQGGHISCICLSFLGHLRKSFNVAPKKK